MQKNFPPDPKLSLKKVSIWVDYSDSKSLYNLLKTERPLPIGGGPAVHRGPQSPGTTCIPRVVFDDENIRDDLKYLLIVL